MAKKNKVVNVEVVSRGNLPGEVLIKRFSRAVKKSGIIQEMRSRRYYEKPSDIKRKERIRRKKLIKKNNQENNKVVKGNRD
jgi:small subunit ribosomal protein S21|tara:strand:- start:602 stop:844 length:243 start_codon:yes stop_codon:yes gene_type:complete